MNSIRNTVTLIGNVGQDPETRQIPNGSQFAKFSVATNENYTDKDTGEKVTKTDWHTCIAWGKTAELIGSLVKKGTKLAVRGKLGYNKYEDSNGQNRTTAQIVVEEFVLLSSPDRNV